MSLFKYLPMGRIDVFARCRIRFSQPAIFNDPFEASPYFSGIAPRSDLEATYPRRFKQILRAHYESLSPGMKDAMSLEFFLDHFESMRPEIDEIFRQVEDQTRPQAAAMMHDKFSKNTGVLSLSEIGDCLLMWAHYAESHSGYVIEFDEQHPYFSEGFELPDTLWKRHKVIYSTQRPQTTVSEFDISKIILTKPKTWEYEREWRMLKPLGHANQVRASKPFPIHLFDFPAESITSVLLGARMPKLTRLWFREKIKLHKSHRHVNLFFAELDEREYCINFKSIDCRASK